MAMHVWPSLSFVTALASGFACDVCWPWRTCCMHCSRARFAFCWCLGLACMHRILNLRCIAFSIRYILQLLRLWFACGLHAVYLLFACSVRKFAQTMAYECNSQILWFHRCCHLACSVFATKISELNSGILGLFLALGFLQACWHLYQSEAWHIW